MTTEEKARKLLMDAWNYFWRHCPDPAAYYGDYIDTKFPSRELDDVIALAYRIATGE